VQNVLKDAEEKQIHRIKLRRSVRMIAHIIQEECKRSKVSVEERQEGNKRRSAAP